MTTVVGALIVLLAGCAGASSQESTQTATPTPSGSEAADRFFGTLGGDASLEGGCLWLEVGEERYELRLPEGYDVDTENLTIVTPDGDALSSGTQLEVTGSVLQDVATICQVGPVIDVSSLEMGE